MSRAARTRLATVLTIALIAILIGAGVLARSSGGVAVAPQQATAQVPPAGSATPAAAPEPAPVAVPVSEDGEELDEELGDD